MLFNSSVFIFLFLPTVLIGFFLLGKIGHHRIAIAWLVGASLFFYGWWNPAYLGLMLFSILFNYSIGVGLGVYDSVISKKSLLVFGLFGNLALLGYYKYANFFVDSLNISTGSNFDLETIILPLAISFFTFQQVAYLVDAYRGETKEYNFLHYCLFVTFFPQLIAGPIVHHKEVLPQFAKDVLYKFNLSNLAIGLTIFSLGLFKKVVLADGLAVYASPVFAAADQGVVITFFEGWSAALSYTFQLYFDFSGYSDMAIGIARMFNVKLPVNFHSPYKAVNIIDFWRRWHITLSCFLRDYLYFPLGGNRKGTFRRYLNLMLTMVLGGLWHGANWTFVVWGGLHGFYLMINHAWIGVKKLFGRDVHESCLVGRVTGRLITFVVVVIAWVMFRSETFSGASNVLESMIGMHGFVLPVQIVDAIPGLSSFVTAVGKVPLLGGGTALGLIEELGMLTLAIVLIFFPALQDMGLRLRLLAVSASMYFTVQAVLFSRTASEFLYFQF